MAEVLQPATHVVPQVVETGDNDRRSLVDKLDELLKSYLLLLDQYTQARRQLSSELSSGYISLAQANFNNPTRTRYGQDFYDERMQALRKVIVDETDSGLKKSISLVEPPTLPSEDAAPLSKPASSKTGTENDGAEKEKDGEAQDDKVVKEAKDVGNAEGNIEGKSKSKGKDGEDNSGDGDVPLVEEKSKKSKSRDPLHWFGILVPPALRTAQGNFVRAVEGPIPRLTNLAAELRALEIEIGRARKQIRKSEASG